MPAPTPTDDIEVILASLTKAQRAWFNRQFIRIGNPVRYAPTIHPMALNRTWDALKRRGIIEPSLFGQSLTPLGEAVRTRILEDQKCG